MHSNLRSAVSSLFDYAGLYPPANRDLASALTEYLGHLKGDEKMMTARFACGTNHLSELASLLQKANAPSFEVAVVGAATANRGDWESELAKCASILNSFESNAADKASIGAFEIKLPNNEDATSWVRDLSGFGQAEIFVELGWDSAQQEAISELAELETVGVKARTGGANSSAYPSSVALAGFLHECCSAEIPFKLTAGLHHPIRSMHTAQEHGFLNVILAAALAIVEDLSAQEIADVLDTRDIKFKKESIQICGYDVDEEDIEDARSLLCSIGSCSIAEPVADLRQLNVWESK